MCIYSALSTISRKFWQHKNNISSNPGLLILIRWSEKPKRVVCLGYALILVPGSVHGDPNKAKAVFTALTALASVVCLLR